MIDINNPMQYKRTQKKKYRVYVCMPKIGINVHNKLEMADYVTDENKRFIIMGTVGETWVIDINKLAKTYRFTNGTPITEDSVLSRLYTVKSDGTMGKTSKIAPVKFLEEHGMYQFIDWMHLETQPGGGGLNWAMFIPKINTFQIPTAWGSMLTVNDPRVSHGAGDFIVCADAGGAPNLNDRWVVNGNIFNTTYDMRAFPGMGSATAKEISRPKSISPAQTPCTR